MALLNKRKQNNFRPVYEVERCKPKMIGIIIVSLLGLGIAFSLILLVVVASKGQAGFRADRVAQADAVMISFYRMQASTRAHQRKPAQTGPKTRIQPVS